MDAVVAEEFARLCQAEVAQLRQGSGATGTDADSTIDVGAMTFPPQMTHIEAQIAEAVTHGARVVAGGTRRLDLGGQFFAPTLLVDVTPEMAVAREETFGPVLPILQVQGDEEALALANDSPWGLSGSVWSRDVNRARALARRLEAGSVCINDVLVNYFCVEAPLGGVKGSGLGFRHGPEALRQFCRVETIVEDHPLLGWLSPLFGRHLTFPYKSWVLRLIRRFMRIVY